MKKSLIIFLCLLICACEQGPAEKQGKQIDKAIENVKDTITQPGPAQKVGRKIDSAVDSNP